MKHRINSQEQPVAIANNINQNHLPPHHSLFASRLQRPKLDSIQDTLKLKIEISTATTDTHTSTHSLNHIYRRQNI